MVRQAELQNTALSETSDGDCANGHFPTTAWFAGRHCAFERRFLLDFASLDFKAAAAAASARILENAGGTAFERGFMLCGHARRF